MPKYLFCIYIVFYYSYKTEMEKQRKSLAARLIQYTLWRVAGFLALVLILPNLIGHSGPMQRAEQTHASNTAYNLKNALSAYFTEYRKFPVPEGEPSNAQLQTDHALMDVLMGADLEGEQGKLNPRRIAFYSAKRTRPMGNGRYRNGVTLEEGDKGDLWDAWGNYYRILLDLDGNGQVVNIDSRLEMEHLPETVLVWSAGPDGDFDTWEDNVTTW